MRIGHARFSLASSSHSSDLDHKQLSRNTDGDMTSNQQSHLILHESLSLKPVRAKTRGSILFLIGLTILSACGCGASSKSAQAVGSIGGNWQFTLSAPSDGSFGGASLSQTNCGAGAGSPCPLLLGGFLLPNNSAINGALTFAILAVGQPPGTFPCSGSAPTTGSLNGQNVTLSVQAGLQTLSLTGTLSSDGKTMTGTYSSLATQGCGTAQSSLPWTAVAVPVLSGQIQGFFHSRSSHIQFDPGFPIDQDFPISGLLTQGPNTGASNATVTGTLNFQSAYPCLGTQANVNGEISGNSVVLQIVASNGLDVGQIGASTTALQFQASPVTVLNTTNGLVLQGNNGYSVSSKSCPGGNSPGDNGNICLAFGGSTACTQPVLISPASLTFPPQLLGSGLQTVTSQTITLTNNDPSGASVSGLALDFNPQSGDTTLFGTLSDFNGLPNFVEQDSCAPSLKTPFTLGPGQSCSVNITFSPQQSCPWLPFKVSQSPSAGGAPPTSCPLTSTGKLILTTNGTSTDSDTSFAVPVTGIGLSTITPFPVELDFGAEAQSESSPPQLITFTNQGISTAQILPRSATACGTPNQLVNLQRPLTPGAASGLQVVQNGSGLANISGDSALSTVTYACDSDTVSGQPNFQITNDACSGVTLGPQQSCTVQVSFVPQPAASLVSGLDFFLELNTLQCSGATTINCEIDSGRFPVELKANVPSPLRMTPGAGLDFGTLPKGQTSAFLSITLFNDPKDPNSGPVNFTGNRLAGDYFETDNCGASLAPGASCTLKIAFTPQIVGFDPGSILIGYNLGNSAALPQTISLRGTGQ